MRITIGTLREQVRKGLLSEASKSPNNKKFKTEPEPKQEPVIPKERDLSGMTIGNLMHLIKTHWKSATVSAKRYIDELTKITDITEEYRGKPVKEHVIKLLGLLGGWSGTIATQVKKELKKRVDSTL